MGRGVSKGAAKVGEVWEGEGLSRLYATAAYLRPQEGTGREGGEDGWIRMPTEEKKTYIL